MSTGDRARPSAPAAFSTARLRCERFRAEHEAELALLDADPLVQATIFGTTFAAEQTHRRALLRVAQWTEYGFGDYVVRLPDGTFVGCTGIFCVPARPDPPALGYALRPAYWGRGFATELATALVALATEELGLRALVATIVATNDASRRVVEKIGFQLAGIDPTYPEAVLYRYDAETRRGSRHARRVGGVEP